MVSYRQATGSQYSSYCEHRLNAGILLAVTWPWNGLMLDTHRQLRWRYDGPLPAYRQRPGVGCISAKTTAGRRPNAGMNTGPTSEEVALDRNADVSPMSVPMFDNVGPRLDQRRRAAWVLTAPLQAVYFHFLEQDVFGFVE